MPWIKRDGSPHRCRTPFLFLSAPGDKWQCRKCGRIYMVILNQIADRELVEI